MPGKRISDISKIQTQWNKRAKRYDNYYKNFKGAIEQFVDLMLLKQHLPKSKKAKILDAAGGTGRIALPLAKLGYQISLCDLSPGMLEVAKRKMLREGVMSRVNFFECNVCRMPFPDERFEFVLCYGGGIKALSEIVRVTKKKGQISICIASRYGTAINKLRDDPAHALRLLTLKTDYDYYENEKYGVVSENGVRRIMKREGIEIIKIYSYDMWNSLGIPKNTLESHYWEKSFFGRTVKILLRLAEEPSVRGISRHWVLYGKKV